MKAIKLFVTACLLLAAQAGAQTVPDGVCTISDTLWNNDGTPQVGGRVTVSRVERNGVLISLGPRTYTSNASGIVSFTLPQGCTAWIYANINGFNTPPSGAPVSIPDSAGTCTLQLDSLQPLASVSTSGMTVQRNDITVGNKHSTLDFSTGFTVTESPTGEANIGINASAIVDSMINSAASIARSKIAAGNAHRMIINGSDGKLSELAALTNGQIPIGTTGGAVTGASITGTTNQVTVTGGAGSITLSTPQNLNTSAIVQFGRATLDTMRITGDGGIKANDDTLYFRKSNGDIAFKIYLGSNPTNAQILKADGDNVLTFQADATGGAASSNGEYIVNTLTSDLTAERQLVAGNGISSTDGGANSTLTLNVLATDGVRISSDSLRILLRAVSGLLIKSGSSAVDSLAADTTSAVIQTKTENSNLYVPLTRMITTGDGLKGGGDLSTNRTFDIMATDGVKISSDTVRVQLAGASGLEIKSGSGGVDSLQIDITGSTLSKSSAGIKVATDGITATEILDGTITNQDVNASAGIARTKLASGNANRILVNDGSGAMSEASALTNGQLLIGSASAAPVAAEISGTSNEITVASGAGSITASLPATIDLGGKTSFEIPNAAAPTVDAFGEIAGDNDLWAASRGAPVFFDGTASTALVNVLVSDTPTNGQQPTWNTGGTITWEAAGGSAATVNSQGTWYLKPIEFAIDSASTLAGDTVWVFQNMTGVSLTVDSIHVAASSDDYAISIVKCNYSGGGGTLVDAVTASTNGATSRMFFKTETTISSATITSGQRIGFKRPASTGDAVYVRIHLRQT